jgi:hypothetical protein
MYEQDSELSIYGSTVLFWTLAGFFSFLILYTVGRTSCMGDQPVGRPLHTQKATQTQNKLTKTSMPLVRFDTAIPAFERAKTVHALDCVATWSERLWTTKSWGKAAEDLQNTLIELWMVHDSRSSFTAVESSSAKSRHKSIKIVASYMLYDRDSVPTVVSILWYPSCLWVPHNILFNEYWWCGLYQNSSSRCSQ